MIALSDVTQRDQLEEYYNQEALVDTDDKIDHLIAETGVQAIRSVSADNGKVMLTILEETVFLGHWRYFGDGK